MKCFYSFYLSAALFCSFASVNIAYAQAPEAKVTEFEEYEENNLGEQAWESTNNTPVVGFDRIDGGLNPMRYRIKGKADISNSSSISSKSYTSIPWERSYRWAKRILDSNSPASDYLKKVVSQVEDALCDGNNQIKSYLIVYKSGRIMQLVNAAIAYSADKQEALAVESGSKVKNCLHKRPDYDLMAAQFSISGTGLTGTAEQRWEEIMQPAGIGKRFLWHLRDIGMVVGKGSHEGSFTGFESVLADAIPIGAFKIVAGLQEAELPRYKAFSTREGKLLAAFGGNVMTLPDLKEDVLRSLVDHYIREFKISSEPLSVESYKYVYDNAIDKLMNIPYLEESIFSVVDRLSQFKNQDASTDINQTNVLARAIGEVGNFPAWILDEAAVLEKAANLRTELTSKFVGQTQLLAEVIRKIQSFFISGRTNPKPAASMLFLGPTGTGKTILAKFVSQVLYQRDPTTIYLTNYNNGSKEKFVETIAEHLLRNSYQVMVFEEIDKASDELRNVLYPLLDEGVFYDNQQRPISARGLIAIATTNAGADLILERGPTDLAEIADPIEAQTKYKGFRDEIVSMIGKQELNNDPNMKDGFRASFDIRFNVKAVFLPFSESERVKLAKIMIKGSQKVYAVKKWKLVVDESIPEWIAKSIADNSKGARPLEYLVEEIITQGTTAYSIATKKSINNGKEYEFNIKKHPTKSGAFLVSETGNPGTVVEYLLNIDSEKANVEARVSPPR